MDWSTFYLGIAGAVATVTGLLFIAIQINLDTLVSGIGERSRAIARSTFTMFSLLLVISLVCLVPGIDLRGRAVFTILAAVLGVFRGVRTWLPVWTSMFRKRVTDRLWETTWLLIGPLIIYAYLILNAYNLLSMPSTDQTNFQTNIALCLISLFIVALRNSWNLIFEATYQQRHEVFEARKK